MVGRIAAALAFLACAHDRTIAAEPEDLVGELNAALLTAMQQADELGFEGRRDVLDPVLRSTFDLETMARVSVGRAWSRMSADQQARMVDAYERMSVATFASRFDGFGGETFEIAGRRDGPRGTLIVDDILNRPGKDPVPLSFVMRETDGGWRIVDVQLDARFSELARQRAEYAAIIEGKGVDALIEAVSAKAAPRESGS